MAYSKGQLEAIWIAANPGEGDPHLMAAIALAESSGSATVVNSIGACGLWQIHPYEVGCTSPMLNARMAGEKLRSQGLGAWETYTNGAYKQYYTGVAPNRNAAFGLPLTPPLPLEGSIKGLLEGKTPNPLEFPEEVVGTVKEGATIVGVLVKILKLLTSKEGWIRIGKVLVGLFLLLEGVLGLANVSSSQPSTVIETGKKATEAAAAVAAS